MKNFVFDLQRFDNISNDTSNTLVSGTSYADSIYNEGASSVSIDAGAGNDYIENCYWTNKKISLNGGAGNDTLYTYSDGGRTLTGGSGSDLFWFHYDSDSLHGTDIITDYAEEDTIRIDNVEVSSITTSGNNIIIAAGNNSLRVNNAVGKVITYIDSDGTQKTYGEVSKLIRGTNGADFINNTVEGATIQALGGNDTISNSSNVSYNLSSVSIDAGDGNDYIYNGGNYVSINAGAGADTINGDYYLSSINGDDGNDSITNWGIRTTVSGGSGNDYLCNAYTAEYSSISGDDGADRIKNSASYSTILGGAGNDSIFNGGASDYGSKVTISGGAGNDTIYNIKTNVSISGGSGNDLISLSSDASKNLIKYSSGDGNDSIVGFDSNDTLQIGGGSGTYSSQKSGSDIIVTVGEGKISLMGAASLSTVNIDGTEGSSSDSKLIRGTSGADSIYNTVEGATIEALGGNDTIENYGVSVSIDAGTGNDYIDNYSENVSINANGGNDTVYNWGNKVTMRGGAGADFLWNDGYYGGGDSVKMDGGNGNDELYNFGDKVTMFGSSGNDSLYNYKNGQYGGGVNVSVSSGAGKDFILNFSTDSTLNGGAGADTISNWSRGYINDELVFDDGGKNITIIGGKGDDFLENVDGENVTFKYTTKDGNDTITGFNDTSTLQIDNGKGSYSSLTSGKNIIVTVGTGKITLQDAASLSSVHIDGVEKVTEENTWKLDGTTATYGTTNNTLIKITNIKSLTGLSLSGNVVTIDSKSVSGKKITLTGDDYTLALADDVVPKRETKPAAWYYSDGTATYKGSYKTKGYLLASNAKSISYYPTATTASTLATVEGVKSKKGLSLSGKVITVAKASVDAKEITLTGSGYTLTLADNVKKSETKPAAWYYSDGTATYKSSYNTAGYKLASNAKSISYYSAATTPTTLASIKGAASTSGLTVSGSKITLKKSALKNKVTVSGAYEFDFASGYSTATITGTAKADTITARGTNISINAGKGDDTIKLFGKATVTGGDGSDTFIYNKGNNVIDDYAAADTISIASGTAATSTSGDDLILTIGTGKITVTGGKNNTVTYFDDVGKHIYQKTPDTLEGVKITKSGKVVTLTDDYGEDTFNAVDLSQYKNKIITINAAKVPRALEITANANSNSITGTNDDDKIYGLAGADTIRSGKGSDYIEGGNGADEIYGGIGSDTLWGGAGDDTLSGGDGNDVFIYGNDDGHDIITDYADIDRIMILSGEKPALAYTPSSNNMTFNIGNGSIIIENPQGQNINFIKSDGSYLHHEAVIRSAK